MKRQIQWAIFIFCLSGIVACSAPSDVSNSVQQPPHSNPQRTHIYTDQVKALEKSKHLTRNLNQAELTRRKQMEEATP
jgi:hypothetical protein